MVHTCTREVGLARKRGNRSRIEVSTFGARVSHHVSFISFDVTSPIM